MASLKDMQSHHLSECLIQLDLLKQRIKRYEQTERVDEFSYIRNSSRMVLEHVEAAYNAALFMRDYPEGAMRLDENDRYHDAHYEALHHEEDAR